MPPNVSAPLSPAPARPRQWEKWVLYAYLRMMGATQRDAASAVGRKKRTVQEWQEDTVLYALAREEARTRWLSEATDAARKTLLTAIKGGHAEMALRLLERVDPDLAPPTQRHQVQHATAEGLSGLLQAFGGHDADPG